MTQSKSLVVEALERGKFAFPPTDTEWHESFDKAIRIAEIEGKIVCGVMECYEEGFIGERWIRVKALLAEHTDAVK